MPFTVYHLGLAIILGYPFRRKLHYPTFILANIVPDIEPFLVFVGVLRLYPLHGYLHTFVAAIILGTSLGCLMNSADKWLFEFFKRLKLVENHIDVKGYTVAGLAGWFLHILVDSPLYTDIKPLYPLEVNPFYRAWGYPTPVLPLLLLASLILYLVHVLKSLYKD